MWLDFSLQFLKLSHDRSSHNSSLKKGCLAVPSCMTAEKNSFILWSILHDPGVVYVLIYITHKLYHANLNIPKCNFFPTPFEGKSGSIILSGCRSMYVPLSGFWSVPAWRLAVWFHCLVSRGLAVLWQHAALSPSLLSSSVLASCSPQRARAAAAAAVWRLPPRCQRTTCRARENIRYSVALSPSTSQRTSPYLNLLLLSHDFGRFGPPP